MFSNARLTVLFCCCLMMTVSGCQSTPIRQPSPPAEPAAAPRAEPAKPAAAQSGRAGSRDLSAILAVIDSQLAAGDPYLAHVTLRELDLEEATSESGARAAGLRIETSIALGLLDEADDWLADPGLAPADTARLRAQLCEARNDHACALVQLNRAAAADSDPASWNDRIWQTLVRAAMTADLATLPVETHLSGWLALLNLVRQAAPLEAERSAWHAWKLSHPDHPAARVPPDALRYLDQEVSARAPVVAVLLPLTGQLQPIGRAVRDGLISAHVYELAARVRTGDDAANLPTLRFIDSTTAPVVELQAQAMADGADVIVGPILREGVSALALRAAEIPVIALNYLDGKAGPDRFYQMGIAIEDEAHGIGELLAARRYEKVLFLVASTSWADRALKEILADWPHEPLVLRIADSRELTSLVGGALSATPEYLRKLSVQELSGLPLIFNTGRRHDLDGIVALTDPVQTSTLGPALSYHSAGRVDTILGTQSYRSTSDIAGLTRVTVSDLPVMLSDDPFNAALRRAWLGQGPADISFHALGADAYRLLQRLPTAFTGTTRTLWGASGLLILGEDRTVRRVQPLAEYRQGQLQSADPG